jgi:hypothetical protein
MSTVSGVVGNHCGGSQWHFSCYYSEVEGQFGNEGAWRAGRSGGSCNFQMRLSFSAPESVKSGDFAGQLLQKQATKVCQRTLNLRWRRVPSPMGRAVNTCACDDCSYMLPLRERFNGDAPCTDRE